MRFFSLTLLPTLLATVCGCQGCTRSPGLPPTVSIQAPFVPPAQLPEPQAPAAAVAHRGQNPWKPDVAGRPWKYIVLHHTATTSGSVDSIHAEHQKKKDKNGNAWLGIGYHFVIGNGRGMADGAIEPTFRWRTQIQGAHAGSSDPEYNQLGIGICLVGNFENEPPTAAQQKSTQLLVQTLRQEYFIPIDQVVPHKEIRASATACPGKLFPLREIAQDQPSILLGVDPDGVPVESLAGSLERTLR